MPGFLLHVGATVMCSHGGQAQPTVPNPRVVVMERSNFRHIEALQFLMGSVRVTSLGQPLLVLSSTAICAPTGTPLVITVTQTRVVAT